MPRSRLLQPGYRPTRRDIILFCLVGAFVFLGWDWIFPSLTPESLDSLRQVTKNKKHIGVGSTRGRWRSPNLINDQLGQKHANDFEQVVVGNPRYNKPIPKDAGSGQTDARDSSDDQTRLGTSPFSAKPPAVPLPHTKMIKHAPGWTVYENLYMAGGVFYVVSQQARSFPPLRLMTSTGLPIDNSTDNEAAREPTESDMAFLAPSEAQANWGDRVWPVQDFTFFLNDPPQYFSNYSHFVGETLMGLWRMYASFDPSITVTGQTVLKNPARIVFARCQPNEWRDEMGFNQFFIHGSFPSISVETAPDWEGRVSVTKDNKKVFRFDKLLLVDRSAAFRGKHCGSRSLRTASEAYEGTREESSRWWWEPLRRSVLRLAGVEEEVMDLNTLWQDWKGTSNGEKSQGSSADQDEAIRKRAAGLLPKVVVTYITRQNSTHRRLVQQDHDVLVKSLKEMGERNDWEVNVLSVDNTTVEAQLEIAARTTVLLGVHGSGLTHLLGMPLTPISTVIEIFIPGGFSRDYEWTARAMNFKHFTVWNDTSYTQPDERKLDSPEGFHGTEIPVHAPSVIQLIEERVEGRS